ncbi:MAG: CRISPR-associated helicase Cas3' [Ignavibacteriales bacterium]|nr:CRISPR-associated helicase Cas3' [Ignavibacteriales bacterium]
MKAYYSHCKSDENGGRVGTTLLRDHLAEVAALAERHVADAARFRVPREDVLRIVGIAARWHDLGKYTSFFQRYLLERARDKHKRHHHARLGAFAAYNKLVEIDERMAGVAYLAVLRHHGDLVSPLHDEYLRTTSSGAILDLITEQLSDLAKAGEPCLTEIESSDPLADFAPPGTKALRKSLRANLVAPADIENYYLVNYLFSLLIEADKLAASGTEPYDRVSVSEEIVERFIAGLQKGGASANAKERDEIRMSVLGRLDEPGALDRRLFTLTAPTGAGKTLTSLHFALKLRRLVEEATGEQPLVVYALPFINIIEQSLETFQRVIGSDAKVLAHYQYADLMGERDENKRGDASETKDSESDPTYDQRKMALETWQADLVVTSFVQLLETLIGYKNRDLKKFHRLAGAIIVLDEPQALDADYHPLIGAALRWLGEFLGARVVLMTATKPLIFELANEFLLEGENEKARDIELLEDHEKHFVANNRTRIVPLLADEEDSEKIDEASFLERFRDKRAANESCLIVVNTVSRSISLYRALEEALGESEAPLFYLSTNLLPAHRLDRINEVRRALEAGEAPVLVATQTVEAGVDLDFDMGFRDLAPVESIVQVAGRINRHNKKKPERPLYVVDFGDANMIYGTLGETSSLAALRAHPEGVGERSYLDLVANYFTELNSKKAFDKSVKIYEAMKKLDYDGDNGVKTFQVVRNLPGRRSVFIDTDDAASEALAKYRALRQGEIGKAEFEEFRQAFYQHILEVPEKYDVPERVSDYLGLIPRDKVAEKYDADGIGFIREETSEVEVI